MAMDSTIGAVSAVLGGSLRPRKTWSFSAQYGPHTLVP